MTAFTASHPLVIRYHWLSGFRIWCEYGKDADTTADATSFAGIIIYCDWIFSLLLFVAHSFYHMCVSMK